ncbi:MAG TPA: translocation/assembly module TamB domain-containing protein, partial [Burkholderiales bacterium]|nr:translocation/assembly module TamB domain-containing protein [Burkholderiales bacterium]
RFGLLNRPDMRLTLSGQGHGDFDGKKIALRGELRADSGYFEFGDDQLPRLSEDVVVVGRKRPSNGRVNARTPFDLDMRLDLGKGVEVNGYGLTGRLRGAVQLSSAAEGEMRVAGRIHAENARFLAYGQRLDVEQGLLIFDGPVDDPGLFIQAWRRNQAVEVGVEVAGTVQNPTAQLISEPPVPEGEKLSWLVLGRAPGDAQGADLALLQAASGTLFGRGDKVGINQQIARKLGLDDVSVRGSGTLEGNVVALGKRFSDKVYIGYEQGLGFAQNLVKLDYSISKRWSARVETGTTSSLGLIYRLAFD